MTVFLEKGVFSNQVGLRKARSPTYRTILLTKIILHFAVLSQEDQHYWL